MTATRAVVYRVIAGGRARPAIDCRMTRRVVEPSTAG